MLSFNQALRKKRKVGSLALARPPDIGDTGSDLLPIIPGLKARWLALAHGAVLPFSLVQKIIYLLTELFPELRVSHGEDFGE